MQLTRPGTTMGSVYYMSPEQVRGGTVDARSDIYSFGVTLYEMLTGRRPFQADTSYSVLNAQLNEAPMPPAQVNPALSQELNNIVLRAMVKVPDGRFQSADEFRNALKSLRTPEMTQFVPQTSPYQQGQRSQTVFESGGFTPVQQSATPMPAVKPVYGQSGSTTPMPIPSMQQPMQMPAQSAPMPPAPAKSHRGLWIGLGAVAAVLALAAAATLLPSLFKTNASSKTTTATATDNPAPAPTAPAPANPPVANPAPQPNAMKPAAMPPASAMASLSVPAPPGKTRPMNTAAAQPPAQASVPPPNAPAAPGASPEELKQAHHRFIDLDARAGTARDSIDTMRKQQQAQGYDMRGDVVTSLNKMNSYLNEANRALAQNDVQTANEYMDRADVEVANLEKFLGR
jgi:hypothetical protein